jgi:tetratricopeptide (TPR) repeat protein
MNPLPITLAVGLSLILSQVTHTQTRDQELKNIYAQALYYSDVDSDHFDIDKAIEAFEKADKINPYAENATYRLAEMYFIKGTLSIREKGSGESMEAIQEDMKNYQQLAEKTLRRVIKLNPKNAAAYSLLGQIYGTWGQQKSAILQFQKAVALDPEDYQTWLLLASDYERQQLYDKAIEAYERAAESPDASIREVASKSSQRLQSIKNR